MITNDREFPFKTAKIESLDKSLAYSSKMIEKQRKCRFFG
jgi:hypothetical protein